jgi:uncharacterized cupin superfamily protein
MPPNVFGEDWDAEQTQPGFTWKRLRLGRRLGADKLGASVFELPPAQRSFPYHLHHANEELLIVLEGSVSVRGKDGEITLERGESVLFPIGRDGAHQVINRSERPARIIVLSTMIEPDITEFPDTGKVGLFAGAPPGGSAPPPHNAGQRRAAQSDDFEEEPTE